MSHDHEIGPLLDRVLDNVPDPSLIVDRAGVIVSVSKPFCRMMGARRSSLVGTRFAEYVRESDQAVAQFLQRNSRASDPLFGRLTLALADRAIPVRSHGSALRLPGERAPTLVMLRLRTLDDDPFRVLTRRLVELNAALAEQQRMELRLRNAVVERDFLLRELHHRTRNNLQLVLSLVGGARRAAAGAEAREALSKVQRRLEAMASVHEVLHLPQQQSTVSARELLQTLADRLRRAFAPPGVTLLVDIDDATLSIDQAIPVALIVNELITNAFKHAFPDDDSGCVRVRLRTDLGLCRLEVIDDGRGMVEAPPSARAGGLGLAQALAQQLNAAMTCEPGAGTRWLISFPTGP